MKKFYIVTTIPLSLKFFSGQLSYLSSDFEICAISSEKDKLIEFGKQEGVRTHFIDMKRPISLLSDICSLFRFIWFFMKERPYVVHGNKIKASLLSMVAA